MYQRPLFSICIPNFNYAAYLPSTIDSVLKQSFSDFEIIIQDNASTDNSWEIINKYAVQDHRIRIFKNNMNVGFAPNLQKATANANGKYIILLSSDDMMEADALYNYKKIIEENNFSEELIICSDTFVVDGQNKITGVLAKVNKTLRQKIFNIENYSKLVEGNPPEKLQGHDVLRCSLLTYEAIGIFCATCYSKALWDKVEGYDTAYQFGPDSAFLNKILTLNPLFIWLHRPLFAYRVHQNNQISKTKQAKILKIEIDGYLTTINYNSSKLLQDLKITHADIVKTYLLRVCIYNSVSELYNGRWLESIRPFVFGFSVYPKKMLSLPKAYLNLVLIFFGPFSILLFKLYKVIK